MDVNDGRVWRKRKYAPSWSGRTAYATRIISFTSLLLSVGVGVRVLGWHELVMAE